MTTSTSTFTPSTQILEAGEQAQALADAGQALKPFFSPEIQETVDGVSKVADALNATGEALKHFGFDEAEPEATTSEVELIPTDVSTDNPSTGFPLALLPVLPLLPTLPVDWSDKFNPESIDELFPDNVKPSTGVIAAGETLQTIGLTGPGAALQAAGQTMRSFGFDEAEEDSITGGGQTMDTDVDDDLGIVFTGAAIAAAIWGGIKVAAPAAAKIVAEAAIVYGTTKAIEAATSDIDSDEGLAQPWLPEIGVDVLA